MNELGPVLDTLFAELAQSPVSIIVFEKLQVLTVRHSISLTVALLSALVWNIYILCTSCMHR